MMSMALLKTQIENVNPCFVMHCLMSHLSYTSWDARVKIPKAEQIHILAQYGRLLNRGPALYLNINTYY